jgi:dsDNA-specific endonuclease/ATPase MutS2
MVDPKELWIGDLLFLTKSGRIGKFAGLSPDGKIRVDCGDKIVKAAPKAIQIHHEPKIDYALLEITKESPTDKKKVNKTINVINNALETFIDLHIEVLAPELKNEPNGKIVEFQLEASRRFIENALTSRKYSIKIIHGKGQGVLKREIHGLLQTISGVKLFTESSDGGSTEVWLD